MGTVKERNFKYPIRLQHGYRVDTTVIRTRVVPLRKIDQISPSTDVDRYSADMAVKFTPLIYDPALEFHHFLPTTALSGDVDALYRLIHDDADVFNRIDEMEFVNIPLHVFATSRNTGFAMEMMSLKPSFARKQ
ncbi:hypothetical protein GQ457_14G023520 [Hibiscus cannabinus]